MKLKIKAFGITKEIVGGREITVETSVQTVAELREELRLKFPALVKLKSLFVAVNHKYSDDAMVLHETDEIALIPPVSGG